MECVIYIRTSTVDQNPLNQLRDCESIRPKDKKIDTFIDYYLLEDKQTAWKDNIERPSFEKLREGIKNNKVKYLIVWDLDRIYRNRKRLITFFAFCKLHNCKIYSYRQKFLNQLNDIPEPWNEILHDMMVQVMGWMAEDESDKKSQRVKSAIRKRKGKTYSYKGNQWGRKPISTYKRNMILKLHNEDMFSLRRISKEVGVSLGVVHKTIHENDTKKEIVLPIS